MIRRLFTPPAHTQRSCSLDGCDVIATQQRLLMPSQIGPCEIYLCEEHAAHLHRVREAYARQIDDIRNQIHQVTDDAASSTAQDRDDE